jgi:hypothetical protein
LTSRREQGGRAMHRKYATLLASVKLLAVLFVALCLVPSGAHLFEMINKLALPANEYMIVQAIYRGWALFGIAVLGALVFSGWHAILVHDNRNAFILALAGFLCIVATQAIFWTFTYPMNAATANWTVMPENFEAARRRWEYSHAVNAILTFAALVAVTLSLLADRRPEGTARAAG